MKIFSVGAELVHEKTEMYTNALTDLPKPVVAFRKSVNAPIYK